MHLPSGMNKRTNQTTWEAYGGISRVTLFFLWVGKFESRMFQSSSVYKSYVVHNKLCSTFWITLEQSNLSPCFYFFRLYLAVVGMQIFQCKHPRVLLLHLESIAFWIFHKTTVPNKQHFIRIYDINNITSTIWIKFNVCYVFFIIAIGSGQYHWFYMVRITQAISKNCTILQQHSISIFNIFSLRNREDLIPSFHNMSIMIIRTSGSKWSLSSESDILLHQHC